MLMPMIGAGFVTKAAATIFVLCLDYVAYILLAAGYQVFYAVSQLDLFATDGGLAVYTEITKTIYRTLSIVMVFVFAYNLILLIINPDSDKGKASTQLVKDTIFSFILVIILPTIFGWIGLFQRHVLSNNTIGAIVLGQNGTIDDNPGKQISMIVFSAFFHPEGTMYSDYFNENGEFIGQDKAKEVCVNGGADSDICESYTEGLNNWYNSDGFTLKELTSRTKLRNSIHDEGGMEYMWLLTTATAVICAYFFFAYAIDLGTRAVKLGVLEIIAPIPVLLKIFPDGKKIYDSWFSEIKKSYLEVFVRLAIIFFIVKLCTLVPEFINAIFTSGSGIEGGIIIKSLATVALILGLLKFAKEAPQLFKTIFASSGGLFAGLDFKPGVKRRISENEYAMKGISTTTGALGGLAGNAVMAFRNGYRSVEANGSADLGRMLGAGALNAIRAMPRGLVAGGKSGFQNTPTEFSKDGLKASFNQGISGGQASEVRAQNKRDTKRSDLDKQAQNRYGVDYKDATIGQKIVSGLGRTGANAKSNWDDFKEDAGAVFNTLKGGGANSNAALDTIKKTNTAIDNYLKLAGGKEEQYDTAFKDMQKKINTNGFAERNGIKYYANAKEKEAAYEAAKLIDPTVTEDKFQTKDDLKKMYEKFKNEELQKAINDYQKTSASTQMATLKNQLNKEIGNLGIDAINEINRELASLGSSNFNDLNSLMNKLSDRSQDLEVVDIEGLRKVDSLLKNQSKQIYIESNMKESAAKDKKDGS